MPRKTDTEFFLLLIAIMGWVVGVTFMFNEMTWPAFFVLVTDLIFSVACVRHYYG